MLALTQIYELIVLCSFVHFEVVGMQKFVVKTFKDNLFLVRDELLLIARM